MGLGKYLCQNLKAGRNFIFKFVIKHFHCLDDIIKDYEHLCNIQSNIHMLTITAQRKV